MSEPEADGDYCLLRTQTPSASVTGISAPSISKSRTITATLVLYLIHKLIFMQNVKHTRFIWGENKARVNGTHGMTYKAAIK